MKLAKKWTALLLAVLMALTALPLTVSAKETKRDLLLATVSDIHYYPESLAQYKGEAFYTYLYGSNCVYDNMNGVLASTFDALANDAKAKGLKYVVACGDLTTNGEYEGHVALAEKFRRFEKDTGIKVFVINGNHDINNSDASQFTSPSGVREPARITTPKEFYDIYREFGFDEAVSTYSAPDTGKAGALSYALSVDGYRLIMIDAGKYSEDNTAKQRNEHETGGNMTEGVLKWVVSQINAAKKAGETPIAFTHWNLSEMNYFHGELLQGFVIDNAYTLQETLADAGLHYVFSGHQHVADLDVTYSDAGEPLYSVITPTLTQFPYAFRETAFSADGKGNITADFQLIDCDATKIVESDSGAIFMPPYRYSGFYLQFGGGSATQYLMRIVKNMTHKYISGIQKAGSVVKYLKTEFELDLEAKIDELINGGFSVGGEDLFTSKNVMSLIDDIDQQVMKTYINDPEKRLWPAVESAIDNLMHMKMSDEPCAKFTDTYGFGDLVEPGTLGDVLFSVMVYMYCGNEDSSDDFFMQSVLENISKPAFVDRLFAAVEQYVVEDFAVNEVLAHTYLHINKLFTGDTETSYYVSLFLQYVFRSVAGVWDEAGSKPESFWDFMKKMINVAASVVYDESSISLKSLVEKVLGTGRLSYGKNVKEIVYYFLDRYFPQQNKEAMAEQAWVLVDGMVNDPDRDYGISYNYTGPVKVTPTAEDMQLPTDVTVRVEGDIFTAHWLTKYSVTGSDLRIREKRTGKAVAANKIKSANEQTEYTGFGFNFGSFGILPYTRVINAHTASASGLTPGGTYVYSIGDAAKGFWSKEAEITVPAASPKSFSFLYLSDYAASNTAAAERFASTLRAARKDHKNAAFAVLGGSSALNGKDDTQFSSVINAAADVLTTLPTLYVAGDNDVSDNANVKKHYAPPVAGAYNKDILGSYYSYDCASVHVAVINTNDVLSDGTLVPSQVTWLRDDLENTAAKWKIVVMDAPVFTGAWENEALAKQLMNLFDELNVDLALEGGAKSYYRSHLISDGAYQPLSKNIVRTIAGKQYEALLGDGFIAVAAGTAGLAFEKAVENKDKFAKAVSLSDPTYTAITVYADNLTVETYTVNASGKRTRIDGAALEKTGVSVRMGDIDKDGGVTTADARLALRYAIKLQTLTVEQRLAADVDFSRSVAPKDARAILRAAIGLEPIVPEFKTFYRNDIDGVDF